MKIIRLILPATAVLIAVAGSFAFRTGSFVGRRIFCNDANFHCTVPHNGLTTINTGSPATYPCTGNWGDASSSTAPCPFIQVQFYNIPD